LIGPDPPKGFVSQKGSASALPFFTGPTDEKGTVRIPEGGEPKATQLASMVYHQPRENLSLGCHTG
jgi:hypothetical protein